MIVWIIGNEPTQFREGALSRPRHENLLCPCLIMERRLIDICFLRSDRRSRKRWVKRERAPKLREEIGRVFELNQASTLSED